MKQLSRFTISVVLPNWNGSRLLEKNLPAVINASQGAEIIVADDASDDNSLDILAKHFPEVKVVANTTRHGFSGNVNSGVAQAHGDIVVLLNTDVRPEKEYLEQLIPHFKDDKTFAVGCLEKSYEPDGVVLRGRGVAHWEKGYFIHSKGEVNGHDTAWVSGGSGAFRRSMWNDLGGMDTIFNPFYWEDIDLSYRAKKAGWNILFEPKSIVGHYHDEGKIKTSYTTEQIKKIVYRNQFLFIWKNVSDISIYISHCFWTPIRLFQALLHGDWLMISGFIWAISMIPNVILRRKNSSRLWKINDVRLFA